MAIVEYRRLGGLCSSGYARWHHGREITSARAVGLVTKGCQSSFCAGRTMRDIQVALVDIGIQWALDLAELRLSLDDPARYGNGIMLVSCLLSCCLVVVAAAAAAAAARMRDIFGQNAESGDNGGGGGGGVLRDFSTTEACLSLLLDCDAVIGYCAYGCRGHGLYRLCWEENSQGICRTAKPYSDSIHEYHMRSFTAHYAPAPDSNTVAPGTIMHIFRVPNAPRRIYSVGSKWHGRMHRRFDCELRTEALCEDQMQFVYRSPM
ncbi:hypothetical protein M747DRAFT_290969 [Aspergillus niger ATCC 13496]|uniref:Contig An04c0330, genomic contig n=3 Tax=Aspergillus niger TaxID=5061 RepID=A2QK48_ASPNC|nr:uncharacterized protein An04g09350 [Aspergillus niger]RDH14168.1 hypothetical protein M747DRAFT_290969 [Aspergillus niger ATCC 13496]CAK39020.1 unnamed protein product [Aspergillus niger]